jgi:calcineurin-like phosphoesterase family protein
VYILGDFTLETAAKAHEYLTQLNGRKYFIRGNHDKFLSGFEPYATDFDCDGFFHGAIHVYGHIANEVDTSAYG